MHLQLVRIFFRLIDNALLKWNEHIFHSAWASPHRTIYTSIGPICHSQSSRISKNTKESHANIVWRKHPFATGRRRRKEVLEAGSGASVTLRFYGHPFARNASHSFWLDIFLIISTVQIFHDIIKVTRQNSRHLQTDVLVIRVDESGSVRAMISSSRVC